MLRLAVVIVPVWLVSLVLVGIQQFYNGRADMAREITSAAAEKRLDDFETKEEIKNELEKTPDADLVNVIIDNGWLLSETPD